MAEAALDAPGAQVVALAVHRDAEVGAPDVAGAQEVVLQLAPADVRGVPVVTIPAILALGHVQLLVRQHVIHRASALVLLNALAEQKHHNKTTYKKEKRP